MLYLYGPYLYLVDNPVNLGTLLLLHFCAYLSWAVLIKCYDGIRAVFLWPWVVRANRGHAHCIFVCVLNPCRTQSLTNLPLDKMAAISHTTCSNAFSWKNENIWTSNIISLKYVPWGSIDNMSALVHIMAWCHPGNKPLSEPMLTWITDTYMQH